MALENVDFFTKCFIMSIPNEYIHSIYTSPQVNEEVYGMESNTVVINEATSLKLGLSRRLRSPKSLIPLTFQFNSNETELKSEKFIFKRFVYVFVDQNLRDDTIVLCEELLFNLQSSSDLFPRINPMNRTCLIVAIETSGEVNLPSRATKVVISLFQSELPLEASFIDKLLQRHFRIPKYLCKGDLFCIEIDKHHTWNLNNKVKACSIYFKVIDLQGPPIDYSGATKGYFVDHSVTMFQASNYQGFLPCRNVPLINKPHFYSLMSNELIMNNILTYNHYTVPSSFNENFNRLCNCLKPFLFTSKIVQGLGLSPIFLLTGPNGSGKSLLLGAVSQFFGVRYWRVNCVNMGGGAPGQGEAKLKAIFNQLKSIAPCILHLSHIEALCQDADNKEDVRVMSCFEKQVKMIKLKWPAVIVATNHSVKFVSSNLNHLFLDSMALNAPNCEERENIISWLFDCNSETLDTDILHTVASQTSGFVFGDLQVLLALAFKERFKRSKDKTKEQNQFEVTDFTKIIGIMHKAYSESIGAPKVPSVLWKDVGGLEHLKKEILRSLRSNMFNSGLKRSGLLLHGPPGTGKTLLAKAVATQCGRNFLSVKGPELLNMYVGQSEHNVRDLFELAKAASPCIIFFDELDSLAPNRGRSGDSGGVMDRVVSQLLAEMDDLGESGDVFILGATNRPDLIDPALLRPGRLDKLLNVGPCEDRSSQLGVLSALTHKLCLDQDVNLQEVVSMLPFSVTGAQLSAVCSAAWLSSARNIITSGENKTKTAVIVTQDHFISALKAVFS